AALFPWTIDSRLFRKAALTGLAKAAINPPSLSTVLSRKPRSPADLPIMQSPRCCAAFQADRAPLSIFGVADSHVAPRFQPSHGTCVPSPCTLPGVLDGRGADVRRSGRDLVR